MEEKEFQYTDEQLADIKKQIEEAVAKQKAEDEALKNSAMASYRKSRDDEEKKKIEKAVADSKLSAEELANKKVEEERQKTADRLAFLESEYKKSQLTEKLTKAGIPSMFVNDTRLLNATEDKVDEVIAQIGEEYKSLLPKGATVDTNVGIGNGKPQKTLEEQKFEQFSKMR